MKKIRLICILILSILFCSCEEQESPAEVQIKNEDGVVETFEITETEDKEEVKKVLNTIHMNAVIDDFSMNGTKVNMSSHLDGAVKIKNNNVTTKVELSFDLNTLLTMNLKAYLMNGEINIDGYTKSESDQMYLNSSYQIKTDVKNDDSFLYVNGVFKIGGMDGKLKNKVSIEEFTLENKAQIISLIDLLKYYKITSFIGNIDDFVETYQASIVNTTKDSFILKIVVPSNVLDDSLESTFELRLAVSTVNFLPISVEVFADDLIKELLKNQYIEEYLTEEVVVEKVRFQFKLLFEYGNYEISELNEKEKEEYVLLQE